ncbi:hypothetical protein FHY22_002677 [Xanthomonas arboricola]|nr:hypothetical protein [Xanthomonas arboricola]MBB3761513.1 hypothetical protein [Xanthomonas arboricola]
MKRMRRLIIRAEPHQILDAWCDANVQRRILRGVAELVAGDGHASRWALQATWCRRGVVGLQRGEARLGESVRYQVDGASLPTGPVGCRTLAPASSTLVLALSGAPGGVTEGGLREQPAHSRAIQSADGRMRSPTISSGASLRRLMVCEA